MSETTLNAARISQFKALSAWILLAWSLPTHALTLGKFQVQSAIGEPLRAEVEVTQFTPDELRGLQAQLAAPANFRQAGMEFNPALQGVVTRIENRNDGQPVITLTGSTMKIPAKMTDIDKDLARTLIMSVASSANGDLRSRAQHMLGQIA